VKIKERHLASDFERRLETQASRLLPGRTVVEEVKYMCPRCSSSRRLEHGVGENCLCGLKLTRWGNILEIEGEVPK